jgi:rod shape-determining protein MreC
VLLLGLAWFFRASWSPQLIDTLTPLLQGVSSSLSQLQLPHFEQTPSEAEQLSQQAQNELLQRQLQALNTVADENQELRALLKLPQPQGYRQVGAAVILRPPHQWFETLTLDKGFEAGLAVNQVVMGTAGVLGKLTEVTAKTSRVQLSSHPESTVSCIVGKQKIPGVLIGRYQDQPAQLQYLQNYARIQAGDMVLTSGLGGVFPPNLVLGKVEAVRQVNSKPVPEASVTLTPLETAISHVVVLVPENPETVAK